MSCELQVYFNLYFYWVNKLCDYVPRKYALKSYVSNEVQGWRSVMMHNIVESILLYVLHVPFFSLPSVVGVMVKIVFDIFLGHL